jgi:DNA-binding NtrC family response regulator
MQRQPEVPIVFVVDDQLDIAKTLAVVLQMNSYDARPFADPREALAAAVDAPPHYLISDITMPSMSGIDLAIAMHERHPACKVLLFSGGVGAKEQIEAASINGRNFAYAEKPMHPLKLVEKLRSL